MGWGEAAPYPGLTTESVDDVWRALSYVVNPFDPDISADLPPTAAAAVDEALSDLAARKANVPLFEHLGGTDSPVPATLAIGLQADPAATVLATAAAVAAGFHSVKLKVAPNRDTQFVESVREEFPDLHLSVDANGSYETSSHFWDTIDDYGLAYVEQPLPAVRLDEHRILKQRLETPICLDESMHTREAALRAIHGLAADLVCVKPALLGIAGCLEIAKAAVRRGMSVKASGVIETSIGRAHVLALASIPGVIHADLAPPTWFLTSDVTDIDWALDDGAFSQRSGLGIGVQPDDISQADIVARRATVHL